MNSYAKLKSGAWGVRVTGQVRAGDKVTVTTKAGKQKTETVERVLWSGGGVSLCAIAGSESPSRYGCGGREGECGSCGSFGPVGQLCRSCGGDCYDPD